MKTNYLLIVFVATAVLFFYLMSNFIRTGNPLGTGNSASTSGAPNSNASIENQSGVKNPSNSAALDFRGPTVKPGTGFIGPQGPPPNY